MKSLSELVLIIALIAFPTMGVAASSVASCYRVNIKPAPTEMGVREYMGDVKKCIAAHKAETSDLKTQLSGRVVSAGRTIRGLGDFFSDPGTALALLRAGLKDTDTLSGLGYYASVAFDDLIGNNIKDQEDASEAVRAFMRNAWAVKLFYRLDKLQAVEYFKRYLHAEDIVRIADLLRPVVSEKFDPKLARYAAHHEVALSQCKKSAGSGSSSAKDGKPQTKAKVSQGCVHDAEFVKLFTEKFGKAPEIEQSYVLGFLYRRYARRYDNGGNALVKAYCDVILDIIQELSPMQKKVTLQ